MTLFFDILWPVLIGIAVVADALAAFVLKTPGITLTEHIRAYMGIGQPRTWRVELRRLSALLFAVWAIVHLFFHWV